MDLYVINLWALTQGKHNFIRMNWPNLLEMIELNFRPKIQTLLCNKGKVNKGS
jgi:hypothetical protein